MSIDNLLKHFRAQTDDIIVEFPYPRRLYRKFKPEWYTYYDLGYEEPEIRLSIRSEKSGGPLIKNLRIYWRKNAADNLVRDWKPHC